MEDQVNQNRFNSQVVIYQVTDDSLLIVACMSILMETQLRQRLKTSEISVVFLANYPGAVIKSEEGSIGIA